MSRTDLRWYHFSREDLADALFGDFSRTNVGRIEISKNELQRGMVAVAYLDDVSPDDSYAPPVLMVVDDSQAPDAFSWLRVYSTEASPASQFCRVLPLSDWNELRSTAAHFPSSRSDVWASVIVGEALANTDSELENLPLSRALACFTFTVARTDAVYGTDVATKKCVSRLRQLESDKRFVRRPAQVADLVPIWAIAKSPRFGFEIEEAAELVVATAAQHVSAYDRERLDHFGLLRAFPGLSSDSVEERVGAFHRLANELVGSESESEASLGLFNVALAAGAFLVGRGTSHAFLLRRYANAAPLAMAWFGLIAALVGQKAWDVRWSRAVKGVERLLRPQFQWTDPPAADLSYSEFEWMTNAFEAGDPFGDLPKMLPRVLTVEVLPGASCQLRLQGGGAVDVEARETRSSKDMSARERALQDFVAQFMGLAAKAGHLMENSNLSASEYPQQNLFESGSSTTRASRGKRGRRAET